MSRQALSIALFGAALAACVPPAQQPAGGGESPRVASTGGGGCDAACARLLDCHLIVDTAACAQECTTQGFGPDVTAGLANGTCADDGAWLAQTYPSEYGGDSGYGGGGGGGGGDGSSCTGGDGTCGGYSVCCASGGGQAAYGSPGVCQQVSVCNMPTR